MIERIHFQEIESTNNYALELLNSKDKVIVTADYQTRGRGRNNKKWEGGYGVNVYFSLGIKHRKKNDRNVLNDENGWGRYENLYTYQSISCLAVKNVLSKIIGREIFKIKYPNDVYARCVDDKFRKVSGSLIEHTFSGSECKTTVIGIGINNQQKIFSDSIIGNTTSLFLLGKNIDNEEIIGLLIEEIESLMRLEEEKIRQLWVGALSIKNKSVNLINSGEIWQYKDILEDGRLVLQSRNIEKVISDGDSIRYEL